MSENFSNTPGEDESVEPARTRLAQKIEEARVLLTELVRKEHALPEGTDVSDDAKKMRSTISEFQTAVTTAEAIGQLVQNGATVSEAALNLATAMNTIRQHFDIDLPHQAALAEGEDADIIHIADWKKRKNTE
jgi:hypothetical protein